MFPAPVIFPILNESFFSLKAFGRRIYITASLLLISKTPQAILHHPKPPRDFVAKLYFLAEIQ